MRAMQDSSIPWLGSVPSHWKRGKLKQYIFEISEKNSPVQTTDILSLTNRLGVVPYEEKGNQGNTAKEKYDEYKLAYPDTIVANSMNILIGSVGYCSYFGCVSPVYYVFKNFKNGNLRYINYIFQTTEFQKCLRQFSNGILEIRQRVSAKTILNQDFFFPNLDEQNAIVEYLDTKCAQIDTVIAKEQSVIEKLQEYKESIINEAVTKGLDIQVEFKPSGYDFIGDIPKRWKLLKVRYLGLLQNGISKSGNYFGYGMPFISYKDVYSSFVIPNQLDGLIESTKEEQEKYSAQSGDIFFTRTSETIDEIGLSSVCKKTILHATFSGFLIRLRLINNIISPDWAKYYFRSNHLRAYFVKEMNLVTRASLSQELLKSLPVLIPSPEEQNKIIKYLDGKCSAIDSIILKKQSLIDKLTEYKKSLIYEVVTGKKEVLHV